MHEHMKSAFAVAIGLCSLCLLGTVVGHIAVGYAADAATLWGNLMACTITSCIGVVAAISAKRSQRFGAWTTAAGWFMLNLMLLSTYRHPNADISAAMEQRR